LIIGVGNDYRSDDAIGLVVARQIAKLGRRDFEVIEASGEGGRLIDAWDGFDAAILIDAMRSGAAPGVMRRVDVGSHPVPAYFSHRSTHAIGVLDAVEMARAMGRLPRSVLIFGIEGARFDAGDGLSPEVERAVPQAVEAVLGELQAIIKAKEQARA
jgi:hydrogenase maturation protease